MKKHVPIDELLALPRVRILRRLLRAGWMDSFDLREACEVGENERNKFSTNLCDAVSYGDIERRDLRGGEALKIKLGTTRQYRITQAGAAKLAALLASAQPDPMDFEDQVGLSAPRGLDRVLDGPKCARCPREAAQGSKLCAPHAEHDRLRKQRQRPSSRVHLCSRCGEQGHYASVCLRRAQLNYQLGEGVAA